MVCLLFRQPAAVQNSRKILTVMMLSPSRPLPRSLSLRRRPRKLRNITYRYVDYVYFVCMCFSCLCYTPIRIGLHNRREYLSVFSGLVKARHARMYHLQNMDLATDHDAVKVGPLFRLIHGLIVRAFPIYYYYSNIVFLQIIDRCVPTYINYQHHQLPILLRRRPAGSLPGLRKFPWWNQQRTAPSSPRI